MAAVPLCCASTGFRGWRPPAQVHALAVHADRPGLGGGSLALHRGPNGLRNSHPAAWLVQHVAAAAQQAERVPLSESAPPARCAGRPARQEAVRRAAYGLARHACQLA